MRKLQTAPINHSFVPHVDTYHKTKWDNEVTSETKANDKFTGSRPTTGTVARDAVLVSGALKT